MRISGAIPVHNADTRNIISIAILKKSLDSMKESGAGIQKIIEQSVNPNLGKHIDVKV